MARKVAAPTAPRRAARWPLLLLLAWTALVYLPSVSNGFVYDDDAVIKEASAFLDHPTTGAFFSTDYFFGSHEATYRPFVTLTYLVDWHIAGGAPWMFHLQNLAWHLAAVAALAVLLGRLGATAFVQYAAAAIYAVHPAITEAVDSVGFREDLLVTSLGLAGLLVAIGRRPRRRSWRVALASACFLLAMLSKETGIVFVALLPLTMWVLSRQGDERAPSARPFDVEPIAAAVCAIFYLIVRFGLLPSSSNYATRIGDSLWASLATGVMAIGYYLRLLVAPYPLCADYRGVISPVSSAGDWRFWAAAAVLAAVSWGVWRLRHRNPLGLWGWIWFLACLAPVSNVIPIPTFMAERFLHLPFVGAVVLAVSSVALVTAARSAAIAAVGAVVVFSGLTWSRHAAWASNEVLWQTTLRDHPTAVGALHGYGTLLVETKRYGEAIPYLQRALRSDAADKDRRAAVLLDLGVAYASTERKEEAVAAFRESLEAAPSSKAHNDLAIVFYNDGALDEAEAHWRAALGLQPDMPEALSGLDAVRVRRGR